jgi:hypothetical protein
MLLLKILPSFMNGWEFVSHEELCSMELGQVWTPCLESDNFKAGATCLTITVALIYLTSGINPYPSNVENRVN